MDYDEALEYIHSTCRFGSKLGLENIRKLLELLGNPQKGRKFVHIAGTNGKGSTAAYISSILTHAGYRTGRFISPYLEEFRERITIDGKFIERNELARITAKVRDAVIMMLADGYSHPTEFEIVTAVAFLYYMEKDCDVTVLEVGLGGRLDSTNVINHSVLSVITPVSMDHTDVLGADLRAIASEKAGIIKQGGAVLMYPQRQAVEEVIREVCRIRGARLVIPDVTSLMMVERDMRRQVFCYSGYRNLETSLAGVHQPGNAALAVSAAEMLAEKGFEISERDIRQGIKSARWPGRMEFICRSPTVIIDGAHNVEGTRSLVKSLKEYFPCRGVTFIMGVMKDKDYPSMLEEISGIADKLIVTAPAGERALPARKLAQTAENYCKKVLISDTIVDAVEKGLGISQKNDIICAFGSLHYIGEVRRYFK